MFFICVSIIKGSPKGVMTTSMKELFNEAKPIFVE